MKKWEQIVQEILPGQTKCIDTTNLRLNHINLDYKNTRGSWIELSSKRGFPDNHRCDYNCNVVGDNSPIQEVNCERVLLP